MAVALPFDCERVVKAAQRITRTKLPSTVDHYIQQCRNGANRVIKDPSHKARCPPTDGTAASSATPPDSGVV